MSNKMYKRLVDAIVIAIIASGAIIILVQLHSFFFPGAQYSGMSFPFRYHLLWLMLTVFLVSIATGVAISFILHVTRKLRETE